MAMKFFTEGCVEALATDGFLLPDEHFLKPQLGLSTDDTVGLMIFTMIWKSFLSC